MIESPEPFSPSGVWSLVLKYKDVILSVIMSVMDHEKWVIISYLYIKNLNAGCETLPVISDQNSSNDFTSQ